MVKRAIGETVWADYKGEKMSATELWRQLKKEYPSFQLCQGLVIKKVGEGKSWEEILNRGIINGTKIRNSIKS